MGDVFSLVLNMSLTGSVVILVVLALRLALKRAPKIYSYALWAAVLFRLLCPVSLSAPVSLLNWLQPEVKETTTVTSSVSFLPAAGEEGTALPAFAETQSEAALTPKAEKQMPEGGTIMFWVWITGVFLMALYSVVSYLRLRRRLVGATVYRGNVYLADYIDSPFVMGVFSPKVYLPSSTPMQERRYIIAHERHHIRRGDPLWKLLGYGALCIHWFNPLAWAAFLLAGRDMEMSCDEAVIRHLGEHIRADYSASLLRLATHKKIIAGMPLAFGEGDTKSRVVNMARWKRPRFWVSALCVLLCLCALIVCALNPRKTVLLTKAASFGQISLRLPENMDCTGSPDELQFILDGQNAGGVVVRKTPDFALVTEDGHWNGVEWVEALGIPEARMSSSFAIYSKDHIENGYPCYGDVAAAYIPTDTDKDGVIHFFYMEDVGVYDIWFDRAVLDRKTINVVMESVSVNQALGNDPVTLPEGYRSDKDDIGNLIFLRDTDIVGGIKAYSLPENLYDAEDTVYHWLEQSGISDFGDSSLFYSGGITNFSGGWRAYFESDVPEGVEPPVSRCHIFYVQDHTVYDLWMDRKLLDTEEIFEFEDTLGFPERFVSELNSPKEAAGIPFNLTASLPEEYSYRQSEGSSAVLLYRGDTVGGIDSYALPEYAVASNSWEWLGDIGIPDYADTTLCHTGGSSEYGVWETRFESDVPPGAEKTVDRYHTFFLTDDSIYDVWFDMMNMKETVRLDILKSITGRGEGAETGAQEPVQAGVAETNAALYEETYPNGDGRVTIQILAPMPDQPEAENGLPFAELMARAREALQVTDINDCGLDVDGIGYKNVTCRITVSEIRSGSWQLAQEQTVPTLELMGQCIYRFDDGNELGQDIPAVSLLTLNALDGSVLAGLGQK